MVAMKNSGVNQLQFNLTAPPLAANLATSGRYRLQPQAIIIEKIGSGYPGGVSGSVPWLPPSSLDVSHESLNLSAVSEQRLSLAVQLVKRDLKKKHEQEQLNALQQQSSVSTNQPSHILSRNRSKTSLSRPNKQLSGAKQTTSKTRLQNRNTSDGKKLTQQGRVTQKVRPSNSGSPAHVQGSSPSDRLGESGRPAESGSPTRTGHSRLPATTNSPPTRDNDHYAHPTCSKDEQLTFDLQRLQRELSEQLDKICEILTTLVTRIKSIFDGSSQDEQIESSDEEARRKFRLNEQASRSARTLYHLQQQVRDIELEYGHLGTSAMGRARKTQALSRLAAAHRGALRSLYTLTTHLQSMTIKDSPPDISVMSHVHQDLVMLCSQLDVETNTELQESLIKKLDQAQEMIYVWRSHYQSTAHINEKQAIEVKQKPHGPTRKPHKAPLIRGSARKHGFIVGFPKRGSKPARQNHSILKKTGATGFSDRQTRLRTGIQSLMSDISETPNGRHETQIQGGGSGKTHNVAWDIPIAASKPAQKGVLLPQAVQERRILSQFNTSDVMSDGHYTDPTIAARLKSVQKPGSRASSAPPSPSSAEKPTKVSSQVPWIPGGSPSRTSAMRRCRSHSPNARRMTENNTATDTDTLDDVVMQLFPEKYGHRKSRLKTRVQFAADSPSQPRASSPNIYSTHSRYPAAHPVHDRINPSLNEASQPRFNQQQYMEEFILNGVLSDTADELNRLELDHRAEEHARHMINMPSFEAMKQRLEEMEREQDEIRQRWRSVNLVDVAKTRTFNHSDASPHELHDPPGSIEIHPSVTESTSRETQDENSDSTSEVAPLLFTKRSSLATSVIQREKLPLKYSTTTSTRAAIQQPVRLTLPAGLVQSVLEHVQEYDSFLKRNQQHGGGRFEPWKLVEEISDELLDVCLTDVAAELEEFNSDLINHVCKSEFAVMETSTDAVATDENTKI